MAQLQHGEPHVLLCGWLRGGGGATATDRQPLCSLWNKRRIWKDVFRPQGRREVRKTCERIRKYQEETVVNHDDAVKGTSSWWVLHIWERGSQKSKGAEVMALSHLLGHQSSVGLQAHPRQRGKRTQPRTSKHNHCSKRNQEAHPHSSTHLPPPPLLWSGC